MIERTHPARAGVRRPPPFHLRRAEAADAERLTTLLSRSYGALLQPDYHPNLLREALPVIGTARPALLSAPGYFVAEAGDGTLIAAGGWTWQGPAGGAAPLDWGHVRHVAADPDHVGQGIGRLLLETIVDHAEHAGVRVLSCLSTLTARGFYSRMGFVALGEVDLDLAPGLRFPAVEMRRALT